ncbi:MAG: mechanosensitive ion channel family protein, partial [Phycisphaerales bacterium]|nr:mechanosensitive ion channel family protein [Phycisphaerales bacterium]
MFRAIRLWAPIVASLLSFAPVMGQDATVDLAARVDAEAARIQADPPVHERDEPWNVPLMEFENELQPLRAEQIDERLQIWLEILQGQVRQRNRLQIAAQQAEDSALRQALLDRSAEHQEIVGKIVTRVRAAMLELQKSGGDISEYKRYVSSVTGTKLNLTDPSVLMAQAMSWVKSPSGGIAVGMKIVYFLVTLFGFWIVSRMVAVAVKAAVNRLDDASELLRDFLVGGVRRTIMVIGLVVALAALGVNITPLMAAIGAAGLVIGLALQGTLSNFASGILILIYKPFDEGD